MTDELSTAAQRTWSFSTHTPRRGRRIAEVVHQPVPGAYDGVVRSALASGFLWGYEPAPVVTAAVHVVDGCFYALTLTGTRVVVVPEEPVPLSSAWLKTALDTLEAVVMVVPPGAFGNELPQRADRHAAPEACDTHRAALNAVRTDGRLLWAAARIRLDQPPVGASAARAGL